MMNDGRKIKLLIIGGYGFGNLGDEAILSATLDKVRTINSVGEISLLSHNPTYSRELHGIKSYPSISKLSTLTIISSRPILFPLVFFRFLFVIILKKLGVQIGFDKPVNELIEKIISSDYVLACGGGYFNTFFRHFPAVLFQFCLVHFYKIPLILTSQSYGPFKKNRFYNKIVKYIVNNAVYVSARDESSVEVLLNMGIDKEKIFLTRDEVLDSNISQKYLNVDLCLFDETKNRNHLFKIGINAHAFRSYKDKYGRLHTGDKEVYYTSFIEAVGRIHETQPCQVVLLPSINEITTARKLNSSLNEIGISSNIYCCNDHFELIKAISQCDYMIATNMHPAIFSILTDVPFVSIAYGYKTEDLFHSIGDIDVIRIDKLNSDYLYNSISNLLELTTKRPIVYNGLKREVERVKLNTYNISKILTSLIYMLLSMRFMDYLKGINYI